MVDLPASHLAAAGGESPIAKDVGGMTIGEVAAKSGDEMVKTLTRSVPSKMKAEASRKARELWGAAKEAVRVSEAWGETAPRKGAN